MKTFLKNYKQTLILLAAIIIGAIAGLVFKEGAAVLSPLGDLFINLMFVIIVPLIFLTISTSISKITQPKRVGKILSTIVLVFVITSLASVLVGMLAAYPVKLVSGQDVEVIKSTLVDEAAESSESLSILDRTVSVLTVNDFFEFCKDRDIKITKQVYIKRGKISKNPFTKFLTNLLCEEALFIIQK